MASKVERHARLTGELFAVVGLLKYDPSLEGKIFLLKQLIVRFGSTNTC
jgi:hypothetical protein